MKNFDAWSFDNSVKFYRNERRTVAELYDSESTVLLPAVPHVHNVLDVGCAAGGFHDMFRELNPAIRYTGVDTSSSMIAEARKLRPEGDFHVSDGGPLRFADGSFDMVLCTGVLLHNPDYVDMVADLARVARRFVVVDMPRLVTQPYEFDIAHSHMVLGNRFPDGSPEGDRDQTRVPYVLANVAEATGQIVERLGARLGGMALRGYYGTPHSASVTLPIDPVVFTVALLCLDELPRRHWLSLPDDAREMAASTLTAGGSTPVADIEALLPGASR